MTVRRYLAAGVIRRSAAGFLLEYAVAHAQLFLRGLREVVRGADVVHLHNPPDTLFPVGLVARALGRSVVFDHHDLFPELLAEKFGSSRPGRASPRRASAPACGSATAVLVTNRSQAESALARGLRPPSGCDRAERAPARNPGGGDVGSRQGELDDPRLVFVGELDSQDGVLALPELLPKPGMERATLTLVGDGALRQRAGAGVLPRRACPDASTFTGPRRARRVPALIAGADVCIDPAPCTELNHRSTMIKVTEYLAAGRPVVAFDLRETRRTAQDAALYAPCDDLARFALADHAVAHKTRAFARRLPAAAEQRAQELVWEHAEEALIDAYDRL